MQAGGDIAPLPRKRKKAKMPEMSKKILETTEKGGSYRVPDRVTGLQEVEELRQLCPGRVWNFVSCYLTSVFDVITECTVCPKVEVDVPYQVGVGMFISFTFAKYITID
jgi:hypothetical protein